MYSIEIASKAFEGLPIVKQHRMINEYLAEDIRKMHGIQVSNDRIYTVCVNCSIFVSYLNCAINS